MSTSTSSSPQSLLMLLGIDTRTILWFIMGVLVLATSYWLKQTFAEDKKNSKEQSAKPLITVKEAKSWVYGIDKLVKYRLDSEKATYFTQDIGTNFSVLSVQLFEDGQIVWEGKCTHGNLSDDMQLVRFNGNISLTQVGNISKYGPLKLTTQALTYDNVTGLITSDTPFRVRQGKRILQANAVSYDTRAGQLNLMKGVTGYYE